MDWYPIKLTTHIRAYAFGERMIGDRLHKRRIPDTGIVAETWEISDYRDTTGTVLNGALAGKTLHDLTLSYPDELVCQGWRGPHFPLLAKFLDASHRLPVHLHADDETAARKYGEPNGKTEAWHILWAAPGATVLAGLKQKFSHQELLDAFLAQDFDAVMLRYPIQTGDTVYVPAGIIHSFGPDALVFEIQQTSDLGQSVMPTDLYGRPLTPEQWHANLRATLSELRTHTQPMPSPGVELETGQIRRVRCCSGPYFVLERWTLTQPYRLPAGDRCLTLTNVSGADSNSPYASVQIHTPSHLESLEPGESCLLPAAIGSLEIVPETTATLIVGSLPDPEPNPVL